METTTFTRVLINRNTDTYHVTTDNHSALCGAGSVVPFTGWSFATTVAAPAMSERYPSQLLANPRRCGRCFG